MLLRCFLLLSVLQTIPTSLLRQNNVCKHFTDYFYPDNNKNCYYDPDTDLETPKLIEKYSGVVEIHPVVTDDGYIITMFRIPADNPKGVLLLHHSIAVDSRIYLWQGNNSLAITLWRNGFDVWLANQRGTTHSAKHINMTNQDYQYWDFSAHEMAIYDVSSELQHIRKKTNNSKVIFMGHSLGSGIGVIYSSIKPKEAEDYLNAMVLMGTPCYFDHTTSALSLLKSFVGFFETVTRTLQIGSPLVLLPVLIPISRVVVRQFPVILLIVRLFVFLTCGETPEEADPTFYNFDALIYANNFSWKTLFHFLQISANTHKFQYYDYGSTRNLQQYGEQTVPVYPINQISVPVLLVSSTNDSLTTFKDSETLFDDLPEKVKVYGHWVINGLNHLDYHVGLHRNELFRDRLIDFLNNISTNF